MNTERRYRLPDEIALELGVDLRPSRRYTLTQYQEERYLSMQKKNVNMLFFDIETSPDVVYSWRIGSKVNLGTDNIIKEREIICISYKWKGDDKVHCLDWSKGEKKMLEDFMKVFSKADIVCGHNCDKFDIRWVRTRCLYHGIPFPPNVRSFDTLKKARGAFYFQSNKLDYIAQLLGVGAKIKHEGFSMWVKVMNGHKDALMDMKTYCNGDVVVLEDVYNALKNYLTPNIHVGVLNGEEKYSCPDCGSTHVELIKNDITPKGTIQRVMKCKTCEYEYKIANSHYLKLLKYANSRN